MSLEAPVFVTFQYETYLYW